MKMNVSYIYLMFFIISVLFSTLFIIAASELGQKSENASDAPSSNSESQESGVNTLLVDEKMQNHLQKSKKEASFTSDQKETKENEIFSSFDEAQATDGETAAKPDDHQENIRDEPFIVDAISEATRTLSFVLVDTTASSTHRAESISASRKVNKVTLAEGRDENITGQLPPKEAAGYVVRAEPKVLAPRPEEGTDSAAARLLEAENAEVPEVLSEVHVESADERSSTEDIPSFSEWAQKQLAEAEKKKVQNVSVLSAGGSGKKLRSKNYASPDCGAKITAANPEAGSASSVLSPSRDEYMLNTCTSRVWFIVELCEAVQAKKIDLANFELFSSSPKEFSVFVSDRYPSRDWQSVGHFTALDERNVQSFDLHPHLFGKYIRVELLSHYGAEHFCPVSLFRVYGTSEFEVLETEDEVLERLPDVDDDDDEEPLDMMEPGDTPKNLFGSARDAVLSIVKKAAEALGQSGTPQNETVAESLKPVEPAKVVERSEWCCSPSHIVVCDNCSDALFGKVFHLLSCRRHYLHLLIDLPLVSEGIRESELCADFGLNFVLQKIGAPYPLRPRTNGVDHRRYGRTGFLSVIFPPEYIAALCNVLAVAEKKVVLNVSYETAEVFPLNLTSEWNNATSPENTAFHEYLVSPQTTCTAGVEQTSQHLVHASSSSLGSEISSIKEASPEADVESAALKIKPTKTLSKNGYDQGEFSNFGSVSLVDSSKIETIVFDKVTNAISTASAAEMSSVLPDSQSVPEASPEPLGVRTQAVDAVSESQLQPEDSEGSAEVYTEEPDLSLDTLLLELKDLDLDTSSTSSSPVSSSMSAPSVVQKESVFLRLSNRIKALERNMSLSGQYLEELSRRYKRQMEEMQRAFDRTLAVVAEESRKGAERESVQAEMVQALQRQVAALSSVIDTLVAEHDSWQRKLFQPSSLLLMVLAGLVMYFTCRGHAPPPTAAEDGASLRARRPRRRKSAEGLMGHAASRLGKRRRPSEEALHILGTYKDLLISEPTTTELTSRSSLPTVDGKRKKRKKKLLSTQEEAKSRRQSDSSSVSPVVVVGDKVLPRRASFSDLVRSHSSPKERTIVSINEQDVWVCDDPDVVVCNSADCVGADESPSCRGVVALSDDARTDLAGKALPKVDPGRSANGTGTQPRGLSSPSYMKTALSARNSRKACGQGAPEPGLPAKLKSDNWRKLYRSSQPSLPTLLRNGEGQGHTNGSADGVELLRLNSSGDDTEREHFAKKIGGGGLRKMVKRFFE
ncbi:SUN domain-containing ossification factor isoform X2 [Bacillus rossius redtenbacheri]|uniref:SUN domain-containing ossification factor isoform X2 n=1 Tax=Bacillus rossius redtenbacheri TaxID=93214 RepID=UPI002FDCD1E0